MKVLEILTERLRNQRGKAKKMKITPLTKDFDPKRADEFFFLYEFRYEYNGGAFDHESIIAMHKDDEGSMEESIKRLISDNNIKTGDQRYIKKGKYAVWIGFGLEEPDFKSEEDEDGPYQWVDGAGLGFIVSAKQLSDQVVGKLSAKLEDEIDRDALAYIEDAGEEAADSAAYAKDPFGYYGLKKSDFM